MKDVWEKYVNLFWSVFKIIRVFPMITRNYEINSYNESIIIYFIILFYQWVIQVKYEVINFIFVFKVAADWDAFQSKIRDFLKDQEYITDRATYLGLPDRSIDNFIFSTFVLT